MKSLSDTDSHSSSESNSSLFSLLVFLTVSSFTFWLISLFDSLSIWWLPLMLDLHHWTHKEKNILLGSCKFSLIWSLPFLLLIRVVYFLLSLWIFIYALQSKLFSTWVCLLLHQLLDVHGPQAGWQICQGCAHRWCIPAGVMRHFQSSGIFICWCCSAESSLSQFFCSPFLHTFMRNVKD